MANNLSLSKNKLKSADEVSEIAENIINTVREPLIVMDKELRIIKASRSFYDFFKVTSDETIGKLIYDLGNHRWNIPKLRELLEKILPEKKSVDSYEVEHDFIDIGNKILLLNAQQIERDPLKEKIILIALEDITERRLAEEKLQESEEIYRELVEGSPDGIIIQQDGIIVFANRSSASMMRGSSIDELIGKSVMEFVHPSFREIIINNLIELKKTGKALPFAERKLLRLDGSEVDVEVKAIPIVFDKKTAVQIIVRDITVRKQIESALKASEERFRTVAGNLIDVVYEWDTKQKIDWYGDIDSIMGYPPGGYPRTFDGFALTFHPEDKAYVMEALENHFKNRVPYNIEYRTMRMDGEWRWWSARGTALRDDKGKPYKMIGSITDITEQKDIQNRIKFNSELLSHIGQAVIATDLQGNVIYWNNGAEEIYGWSSAVAMGQNVVVLIPTDQTKEQFNEIMKELSDGKLWSGEILVKRKDGSIFPAEVTNAPIIDSDGKLIGIIGISSDITERKRAEEELIEAKEKAEEMNRLKTNFLANMSHELRTPLVGILGYADFLRQDAESEENREMAETIFTSGKRLSETLNLILDLSQFETEKKDIKYHKVDLVSKANEIITLFRETANKKRLSLKSSFSQDSIIINFDERAFHSILNNLINNAIKFTIEGSIATTISLNDDFVEIKVSDTGIGIAEENYQNIFEEFRQASEGYTRNFEGSGLGLSITKKLVEKFGGTITVESEIGKGSTFKVRLPVTNALENLKEPTAFEIHSSTKSPKLKSVKPLALVVDDDPFVFLVLKRYTSKYIELDSTVDAEFAFKKLYKKQYDLIFMDINLRRGMDGKEATKKIRTMKGYESIPIIASTAYAMAGDKEEFLAAGCTHYLSKPFSRIEIEELVEKVLKLI